MLVISMTSPEAAVPERAAVVHGMPEPGIWDRIFTVAVVNDDGFPHELASPLPAAARFRPSHARLQAPGPIRSGHFTLYATQRGFGWLMIGPSTAVHFWAICRRRLSSISLSLNILSQCWRQRNGRQASMIMVLIE